MNRFADGAAFARLSALVASVVLLTSRIMLLVHEFGGHAAPATLFGGRLLGWYLFLFAGGRVSYRLGDLDTGRRLVVSLGGIALELLFGAIAFLLARRMRESSASSSRCAPWARLDGRSSPSISCDEPPARGSSCRIEWCVALSSSSA